MTKKIVLISVTLLILILVFLISAPVIKGYISYINNKNTAMHYVENTYGTSATFIIGQKGKSPWIYDRSDKFVFFQKNEEFYFNIFCVNENISDCYMESFRGSQISKAVKEKFSNKSYNLLIETFMYGDELHNDYSNTYCSLIILSATSHIDMDEMYNILDYMISKYPKINITFRISDAKYKEAYTKIFRYEQVISLDSIPYLYRGEIANTQKINYSKLQDLFTEWEF